MTRSHALAPICAAVLLAGSVGTIRRPALAAGQLSHQTRAVLLIKRYFAVLSAGMRTGNFSSLTSIYAPNATLTMYRALPRDTYLERTRNASGLVAITRIYGDIAHAFAGCRWIQTHVYATVSGARVVSDEHVLRQSGSPMSMSFTVATIHGGKITHLDWTLDFGVGRSMQ